MASAAPAAPASTPASGAPVPSAGGEGTPAAPTPTRKIAPIPDRVATPPQPEGKPKHTGPQPSGEKVVRNLPGVILNPKADPSDELFPKLGRNRDPETGKFISEAIKPDLPEGAKPEEAPEGKPPAPEGMPQEGGVKFLGKAYKDLAEVEQLHRTLQGNHRALADANKRLTDDRDYGYQAAHAWKAEFERVNAELQAVKSGRPAPSASTSPTATPTPGAAAPGADVFNLDEALSGIDTDAFEMIATNPKGGLAAAARYLVSETLRTTVEKLLPQLASKFDQRVQPLEGDVQSRSAQMQQEQVFTMVASLRTGDGKPAFPELADAQALDEIGQLWATTHKRVGWTQQDVEQSLSTAEGIIQAVALYRTMKGFAPAPAASATPSPSPSGEPAPAPGAAASMLAEPGSAVPPNSGRSNLSPEAQRLVRALEKTELVDPVLGFTRNRRE